MSTAIETFRLGTIGHCDYHGNCLHTPDLECTHCLADRDRDLTTILTRRMVEKRKRDRVFRGLVWATCIVLCLAFWTWVGWMVSCTS